MPNRPAFGALFMSNPELVLVTGATGFIAGHCVRQLLEAGYRVRGTVRSLAGRPAKLAHLRAMEAEFGGRLELVEAELLDEASWEPAVRECAFVLHVASPFPAALPKVRIGGSQRRSRTSRTAPPTRPRRMRTNSWFLPGRVR